MHAPIREREWWGGGVVSGTRPWRQTALPLSAAEGRSRSLRGQSQPRSVSPSRPWRQRTNGRRYFFTGSANQRPSLKKPTKKTPNPPPPTRIASFPQPPEVRVAPAGDLCYGAGSGPSPRSRPPLGVSGAIHAMTRPLGMGVPPPGPPVTRSRRHFTPTAAARKTAQDVRYGRGAAEGRTGAREAAAGSRQVPCPPSGAPDGGGGALPVCTAPPAGGAPAGGSRRAPRRARAEGHGAGAEAEAAAAP